MRAIALPKGACRKLDAKCYVQDGLVAMWDGIENAGWGTHDATTTTWKDLIGSADATFGSGISFRDNCIEANSSQIIPLVTPPSSSLFTVESVNELLGVFSMATANSIVTLNTFSVRIPYLVNSGKQIYIAGVRGQSIGSLPYNATSFSVTKETDSDKFKYRAYSNGIVVYTSGSVTVDIPAGPMFLIGQNGHFEDSEGNIATRRNYCTRLYNRALTAAEIAYNYSIDKARFGI